MGFEELTCYPLPADKMRWNLCSKVGNSWLCLSRDPTDGSYSPEMIVSILIRALCDPSPEHAKGQPPVLCAKIIIFLRTSIVDNELHNTHIVLL